MSLRSKFLSPCALLCILALTGCSSVTDVFDNESPALEGERISVLELQKSLEPDSDILAAEGLIAPAPWKNEFWPQAGGYPNHSMQHLDLNEGDLKKIWSADIGDGSRSGLPLTAQPIVIDGRVFTLDTNSQLSAFDTKTGKMLWRRNVRASGEDDQVIGGGVAYARGILYVTNGYNEVLSLKPDDGTILWRSPIPAPSRAAPTIIDERIFITTLDNRLLALSTKEGSIMWEHTGLGEIAGLVGAASPAASRNIVVPVFSSGEISALRVQNGSVAWSDNLSSLRRLGGGLSNISDIKALPVIDKGMIFAISFSGNLVAIDERTGTRVWQREIGGSNVPWLAGNHLFVLSSENNLIALGRKNGAIHWVTELPKYKNEKKQKGTLTWTGPILAGGRLILSGTDGRMIDVDPQNGKIQKQWSIKNTVAITPIVAGGTLYLLSENGTLFAYR